MALSIVDVDVVKTRLGLNDESPDLDATIESALSSVQRHIETILETKLDRALNQTDTFFMESRKLNALPPDGYRLRLKNGFVTSVTSVKVALTLNDTQTLLTVNEDYRVDLEKGIVYILDNANTGGFGYRFRRDPDELTHRFNNYYAFVEYASGFEDDAAPEWLQEAAIAYTPMVLNAMQTTNRNPEYAVTNNASETVGARILEPFMRGRSGQFRALF